MTAKKTKTLRLGTDGQGGATGGTGAHVRGVPESRTPAELRRIAARSGTADPVAAEMSQRDHVEAVADLSDQAARREARRLRQGGATPKPIRRPNVIHTPALSTNWSEAMAVLEAQVTRTRNARLDPADAEEQGEVE